MYKIILIFFLIFEFSKNAKLPSTFQKCNKKEPNFNQCLTEAVRDALHQLNTPKKQVALPSLEPFEISQLDIEPGTGAVQFKQTYKNLKIWGYTKPDFFDVKMNFDTHIFTMKFNCTEILLEFEYEVNGKIIMMPISGSGSAVMLLHKTQFVINFFLKEYQNKNKNFYKVLKTESLIEPNGITFKLENLFNGNKALGDSINRIMSENWQEVYGDVKKSYEEAFGQIFGTIFDNFLHRVPISELFD